jgi:hypothetical protein
MKRSEYEYQAFVNQGLDQQRSLDSPEGSAALLQANKPEVDATDLQKERFLANSDRQRLILPLSAQNPAKQSSTTSSFRSKTQSKR